MFAIIGSVGCAPNNTGAYLTSELVADFSLEEAAGCGLRARATFWRTDAQLFRSPLQLGAGDRVEILIGGERLPLEVRADPIYPTAERCLGFDPGVSSVQFQLFRAQGEDAPMSTVSLPPPFRLERLPGGDISRDRDDLVLRWTNPVPDGRMAYLFRGVCIETFVGQTADDGEFVVEARTLDTEYSWGHNEYDHNYVYVDLFLYDQDTDGHIGRHRNA